MSDPLFKVKDQVVIVSGGSRGIGRAIAVGFARRGAKVVVTGRDTDALKETVAEMGDSAAVLPLVCDVTKRGDIEQLVTKSIEQFGHIDTLVNVAGVNIRKPMEQYTEQEYDHIVNINQRGAFFMTQIVGKHMLEHGRGNVINIESLNSHKPLKNVLPYAMSKAALTNLTRGLALEWGSRGVRVNGIAPGFVLTDLTQKLWSDPTMRAWGESETPVGRLGVPDDMVGAAIFLASQASAFMTGQTIYVDGGFIAAMNWPIPE